MADETENLTLRLLRELRAAQDTVVAEIREANAKLDALVASADMKHDRRVIELAAIRGRVRRVEETMEAMACVMTGGAFWAEASTGRSESWLASWGANPAASSRKTPWRLSGIAKNAGVSVSDDPG